MSLPLQTRTPPAPGDDWPYGSTAWGEPAGDGPVTEQISPVDGSLIQRCRLLSDGEIDGLIRPGGPCLPARDVPIAPFCGRLHDELTGISSLLVDTLALETGFVRADCRELVQGTLDYVKGFPAYWEREKLTAAVIPGAVVPGAGAPARRIRTVPVPWGTIAVILPQNAFLLLGITALLNGLASGNRVILRAPMQSARSAALLSYAVQGARAPANAASVILARAQPFLQALYRSSLPCLVHYLGSSRHAPSLLADAFAAGTPALVDGEGNGWVWVGPDAPVEWAAGILTTGALRYNGATCTSINGAIIHPSVYPDLRSSLAERWRSLKAGNPLCEDVDVGPLFEPAQAADCELKAHESGGRVLSGGHRRGALFPPTLVEEPSPDSALVREGVFGSALWIAPGDAPVFRKRWALNRYPLGAGVLSPAAEPADWAGLPHLARLVMNGDPSVEDIFEPWGGYPGSGANPVGSWTQKYSRIVQIDEPATPARNR